MSRPPLFKSLFPVNASLFLILFVMLSLHARISGDDFFYLGLTQEHGVNGAMLYQYEHWSGRWSAHWIGCALIGLTKYYLFLPALLITTLLLFIHSVDLFVKKFTENLSLVQRLSVSTLIAAAFFFGCFSVAETFFWYIIVFTYLWSIIAGNYLLYLIYFGRKNKMTVGGIIIAAAYIGGAAESLSLFYLLLVSTLLVISWKRNPGIKANSFLLIALGTLLIASLIAYLAPGTFVRNSLMPETGISDRMFTLIKSFVKSLLAIYGNKILFLLCFLIPISAVVTIPSSPGLRSSLLIYFSLMVIALAPTALVMSEQGPARALAIVALISLLFVLIVLLKYRSQNADVIYSLASLAGAIYLLVSIVQQHEKVNVFAQAYDQRMDYLLKLKQNNFTGIADLKPLPDAGWLYHEEISEDTAHYNNKHLVYGMQLGFAVKLHR